MQKISFIIFVLLFYFSTVAKTDSLLIQIQSLKGPEKLKTLQSLTKKYISQSPDSCVKYGSKAIILAKELHDKYNEALANKRIGYSWYLRSEYDKGLVYFGKAYQLDIENHDFLNAAEITNLCGDAYNQKGDYQKAIHYFTETEKSCDSLIKNDSLKNSVKKLYSILYTNMGLLYHTLDSVKKPLTYFENALKYAMEINDSTRIAASYCNIGMICKRQKKYKLASHAYLLALKLSRNICDKHYECKILNNIANIFENQDKIDSAMLFIKMARKISIELGDKSNLTIVNRNIARYFIQSGQYDSAYYYISMALVISQEIGALQKISENYKVLSEVYEKKGKKELALKYYKRYEELKDSVSGQETREKIAEIQTKYETEKKEKENVILRKDNQIKEITISKKNILLYVFVVVTFVILIFLVLIFVLLRVKSRAYQNLVSQNLRLLQFEKKFDENIVTLPESEVSNSPDSNELYQGLGLRLQKFLIEEKPYLWSDVNMDEFCRKLNTNRTYLSKLINDQYHQNFYDLICEYRIRSARDMLQDTSLKHLSVEGIGEVAGFKSNSNFHKKFKTLVGLTPNQFRDRAVKNKLNPE
ncbi:MAG: AraC family transcriptional regulator [Bacteroidetes bacterium]|nr:AraC family transcriptional regulator [Bacteroidota bacterium]